MGGWKDREERLHFNNRRRTTAESHFTIKKKKKEYHPLSLASRFRFPENFSDSEAFSSSTFEEFSLMSPLGWVSFFFRIPRSSRFFSTYASGRFSLWDTPVFLPEKLRNFSHFWRRYCTKNLKFKVS